MTMGSVYVDTFVMTRNIGNGVESNEVDSDDNLLSSVENDDNQPLEYNDFIALFQSIFNCREIFTHPMEFTVKIIHRSKYDKIYYNQNQQTRIIKLQEWKRDQLNYSFNACTIRSSFIDPLLLSCHGVARIESVSLEDRIVDQLKKFESLKR
jgi:hypothetical protein